MKTLTLRFARTALMLLLATLTTNMWAQTTLNLSGEGTEENPYLIETAANWDNLADYVAEGNNCEGSFFKMTANIGTTESPITKPLGKQIGPNKLTDRRRFAGTFDGNGKTLTVNITNLENPWYEYNKNYCAPFAYAQNVTIKNLHVTGTIVTTGQFASGLVGQSGPDNKLDLGICTIDNCHVSVNFVGNTEGNSTYGNHGTFISIAEGNATITNSWFDGSLTGKNYYYSGGFIGLNKATANLNNCLFNPSEISIENNHIGGSSEFSHDNGGHSAFVDCYYTKSFSEPEDAQGIRVFVSYPTGSDVLSIDAPDGNSYYIIKHNINWVNIVETIENNSSSELTITNDENEIIAGTEDKVIEIPAGKTLSLHLNGHTLNRGLDVVAAADDGCVFKVLGTLNVDGGTIKGGNNTGNGGAIYNEGTLIVTSSTISSSFANKGGAIYVNSGEVTINGSTISGNKATTSDGASGSGIFLYDGTLTLNGCTIQGNTSNTSHNSYGVGVYVNDGTFNVSGKGIIKDNKCSKSKTQQNLYLKGENVINITNSISGSVIRVSKENGGVFTNGLDGNGNINRFYCDDGNYLLRLNESVKEAELHRVYTFNKTGDWNDASKWYNNTMPSNGNDDVIINKNVAATIPSDYLANVGEITIYTGGSLTIADGGQLITKSAVTATVQKNITGATDWSTTSNGWYFIASPVNSTLLPSSVSNLLTDETGPYSYDLFRYNTKEDKWENYVEHNGDFTFENGMGYLYANADDKTLEFTGEIKPYTTEGDANQVTLDNDGWNLIGNPFTCKVTVDKAFAELNNAATVTNQVANSVIYPCAGIMVNGTAGEKVTFTQYVPSSATGNQGLLDVTVKAMANNRGGSTSADNAIVSFSENNKLEKFYFGDGTKLYIPQDGLDYAIAYSERQGEMPVNFKAAQEGTYTLTVNPTNVEMGYLHLIDNKTGDDIDLLALRQAQGSAEYTFTATMTDDASRFRLVFDADSSTGSEAFAYYDGSEWVIANSDNAILQVVDILGRIIVNKTDAQTLNPAGMASGVYVLRLVNGNSVKTQKIIVR